MADAIFKRASVRRFTDDPMTDDEVRAVLRAGMAAPSGGNQQPWEFYVARDRATLQLLSEASPYAKPAAGAACDSVSACVENILLEAVDLGFGAVWMGIAPEPERMAAVSEIVGAPAGLEPFAIVALGYPESEPHAKGKDRYAEDRVHWLS